MANPVQKLSELYRSAMGDDSVISGDPREVAIRLEETKRQVFVRSTIETSIVSAESAALTGEKCFEVMNVEPYLTDKYLLSDVDLITREHISGVAGTVYDELDRLGYEPKLESRFQRGQWLRHWAIVIRWAEEKSTLQTQSEPVAS